MCTDDPGDRGAAVRSASRKAEGYEAQAAVFGINRHYPAVF